MTSESTSNIVTAATQFKNTMTPGMTTKEIIINAIKYVNKHHGSKMSRTQRRDFAIDILRVVSNGLDGIPGTADDLISQDVINALQHALKFGLVQDMIDVVLDASKGKYHFMILIPLVLVGLRFVTKGSKSEQRK